MSTGLNVAVKAEPEDSSSSEDPQQMSGGQSSTPSNLSPSSSTYFSCTSPTTSFQYDPLSPPTPYTLSTPTNTTQSTPQHEQVPASSPVQRLDHSAAQSNTAMDNNGSEDSKTLLKLLLSERSKSEQFSQTLARSMDLLTKFHAKHHREMGCAGEREEGLRADLEKLKKEMKELRNKGEVLVLVEEENLGVGKGSDQESYEEDTKIGLQEVVASTSQPITSDNSTSSQVNNMPPSPSPETSPNHLSELTELRKENLHLQQELAKSETAREHAEGEYNQVLSTTQFWERQFKNTEKQYLLHQQQLQQIKQENVDLRSEYTQLTSRHQDLVNGQDMRIKDIDRQYSEQYQQTIAVNDTTLASEIQSVRMNADRQVQQMEYRFLETLSREREEMVAELSACVEERDQAQERFYVLSGQFDELSMAKDNLQRVFEQNTSNLVHSLKEKENLQKRLNRLITDPNLVPDGGTEAKHVLLKRLEKVSAELEASDKAKETLQNQLEVVSQALKVSRVNAISQALQEKDFGKILEGLFGDGAGEGEEEVNGKDKDNSAIQIALGKVQASWKNLESGLRQQQAQAIQALQEDHSAKIKLQREEHQEVILALTAQNEAERVKLEGEHQLAISVLEEAGRKKDAELQDSLRVHEEEKEAYQATLRKGYEEKLKASEEVLRQRCESFKREDSAETEVDFDSVVAEVEIIGQGASGSGYGYGSGAGSVAGGRETVDLGVTSRSRGIGVHPIPVLASFSAKLTQAGTQGIKRKATDDLSEARDGKRPVSSSAGLGQSSEEEEVLIYDVGEGVNATGQSSAHEWKTVS